MPSNIDNERLLTESGCGQRAHGKARCAFLFAVVSLAVNACHSSSSTPAPVPPAPTIGLDERPANAACLAGPRPANAMELLLEPAFTALPAFTQPVAMLQAPDDSSLWYVVEQGGRILRFDNDATATVTELFVDIGDLVDLSRPASGLLSMAFHPNFATNDQALLYYTRTGAPFIDVLARFVSPDGGRTLDPNSGTDIVALDHPSRKHFGGQVHYGPDGFVYLAIGDGGESDDFPDHGQNTSDLFATMIRIDPDGASPYAIPVDNPFAGNPLCTGGTGSGPCPEIFAWGFHNPWRWSFDRGTGEIWLADVGQRQWEEVDIIQPGGNYGWSSREGAHCFDPLVNCPTAGLIDPVIEYGRSEGNSITGGYVYRGNNIPGLVGSYVFGDFAVGRIWGLFDDGAGVLQKQTLLETNLAISSFAEGNDGELFVLDYVTGRISALVPNPGGPAVSQFAATLGETGCFAAADPTMEEAGLIPYDINAPFWSDGATKERWLAIPDGATIDIGADGDWSFPNGTVLAKNFFLNGRRIETRLFVRHDDGIWAGYSYEWNDAETDAVLVQGGKSRLVDGQQWVYPSSSQCLGCHTAAAGRALGLETAQLNRDLNYEETGRTANQLATYDAIGLFSSPLAAAPANLPRLDNPHDDSVSLEQRARAYLHTNCSQCHRPNGPTQAQMDLRYDTSLADSGVCDVPPGDSDLGVPGAVLLRPGEPASSILPLRMARRDAFSMPPDTSNRVDDDGVALINDWIAALDSCN